MNKLEIICIIVIFTVDYFYAQNKNPNMIIGKKAVVHLFEWRWDDIATECEKFLEPMKFGGVQVSPVTENIILEGRPWYERYQTVSYKIATRSGNETQFQDMVRRCNNVGVRIYADVVINHMTGNGKGKGTGGTYFDADSLDYPGVPYNESHFHSCSVCKSNSCNIEDWNDPDQLVFCRLVGLKDLNQSKEYVRQKIVNILNRLTHFGVAGFRVDAAKHIKPVELQMIYNQLDNLNPKWFPVGAKPFIYQEVSQGGRPLSEFSGLGRVTEFRYGSSLGHIFYRQDNLSRLQTFGKSWGMVDEGDALVFLDNHDTQRTEEFILTYKTPRIYKMAAAFMLAWPYGIPRVMSSFAFTVNSAGPPSDKNENTKHAINKDGNCADGWVCEHHWKEIRNMVRFGIVAGNTSVHNWWAGNSQQIAFSRGDKAFIAINNADFPLNATIQTGLESGVYCDAISGKKVGNNCTGKVVIVKDDGNVYLNISSTWDVPVIAIHSDEKLVK